MIGISLFLKLQGRMGTFSKNYDVAKADLLLCMVLKLIVWGKYADFNISERQVFL